MHIELSREQIHEFMSLVKSATELLRTNDDTMMEAVESGVVKWLEQHQSTPIVVGLSDEQVQSFYMSTPYRVNNKDDIVNSYHEWAKTQTFTSQFIPDWSVAPSWANWVAQGESGTWAWYEKKPTARKTKYDDNGLSGYWHFPPKTQKKFVACITDWDESLQSRPNTQ